MKVAPLASLLSLTVALSGCGMWGGTSPEPSISRPTAARGLNVSCWTFDDDRPLKSGTAAEFDVTLMELAEAQTQPAPEVTAPWTRQGLQLLIVDASQLGPLLETIRITGPLQQQRLNELPRWTAIHSGPESILPMILELDDGPVQLAAGELRLLARAYIVPGAPADDGALRASMQLELAVQHLDTTLRADDSIDLAARARVSTLDEGPTFPSMNLQAQLSQGQALLIIPIDGTTEQDASTAPPEPQVGPLPPTFPRIGEALLTDYSRLPRPTSRTILVLEPLLPTRFSLPGG